LLSAPLKGVPFDGAAAARGDFMLIWVLERFGNRSRLVSLGS